MAGWIKLYRQIQESDIWETIQPFDIRSAWIDLLLLASHEDRNMIIGDQVVSVERGQYVTSIRFLSQRWCWSKDRVSKCLHLLEKLGMITKHSDSKRTVITIVNYGKFQDCQDTDKDSNKDSERTLNGRCADADKDKIQEYIKNDKKGKNGKKNIYGEYQHVRLTDEERDKLMDEYGEAETSAAIKYLDEYIEMKGYKAKSHYLCIKKWVFDAVNRDKPKSGSQIDWSKV